MTNEDVTSRLSQKYSIPSKRTKDDSEDILKKASLAHMEGRLREAEKGYLEVLRKKPDWGQVLNALGTVFLDQSQPDKAKKVFEKATDLRPPYLPACYNLARLKQRENDHKGAISIYRAILKRQPGYGQAWNNLGIAYRETRMKPYPVFERPWRSLLTWQRHGTTLAWHRTSLI
jgi:Tfp pilus assembly protein PilF